MERESLTIKQLRVEQSEQMMKVYERAKLVGIQKNNYVLMPSIDFILLVKEVLGIPNLVIDNGMGFSFNHIISRDYVERYPLIMICTDSDKVHK